MYTHSPNDTYTCKTFLFHFVQLAMRPTVRVRVAVIVVVGRRGRRGREKEVEEEEEVVKIRQVSS